ncbi:sigma-70 family RNA polymerase sigma factor [Paracrocinitomix mangrovi]|uniref:RNA polymerase sigma factor n=1 Tax=Paracrocinitomix mangrovi TaxID=2862509 RepID=UPI001C8DA28B|nr:sigma-70 family RNA polymerase sigma factor [Paracrocinitomix mangrovi]UKN03618.1 sigma-70 family RNA polymerase sigma factor [Paracrocinitomix mangrovi]
MTAFEFNSRVIALNDFISRFALQYTKDEDLAKDLAQETILKALTNREKFRTNTNLKGWLKVILKNTFINSYRKKSNQMISYNSEYYRVMNGNPDEYKPDDILMTDHIEKLINDLDPAMAEPFKMHFEGFKYHEIAEELDLPLGTVKSRIHQSRKVLAKKVER